MRQGHGKHEVGDAGIGEEYTIKINLKRSISWRCKMARDRFQKRVYV